MVANNVRYSNEGKWGKAYTDIDWREDNQTFDDSVKPWLASFQWDDSVAYMDTLTDENGEYGNPERISESYQIIHISKMKRAASLRRLHVSFSGSVYRRYNALLEQPVLAA